ncbi:EamA family transporter [Nesterenkonia sp.]|uniref:EamA family transporter n=1 Tax=Nesterenkonia sp. TaxID=704201 RepID=UPI00262ECE4C|nr:EamA family transporter [Nesterenkonia sp.]
MTSRLSGRPGRGLAVIASSAASTQAGAAVGAQAFAALTPIGVVAGRQLVAALVMLAVARPRFWRYTRGQWLPILGLAAFFAGMNSFLYAALERIGLGMAVTIEFLGPLAVALLFSRAPGARLRSLLCAALALGGVLLLTRPGPTSDVLGLAFAVLAAACWAGYILTNRVVGRRVPGVEGTAVATMISAAGMLPVALVIVAGTQPPLAAVGFAIIAGLLSSAVPYTLDLIVLRHISPVVFGLGMSLHPVFAALIGVIFLQEDLPLVGFAGVVLVACANALTLISRTIRPPEPDVSGSSYSGDRPARGRVRRRGLR